MEDLGSHPAAQRSAPVVDVGVLKHDHRHDDAQQRAVPRHGDLAGVATGQDGGMAGAGHLEGEVAAGVAPTHHEHGSGPQLTWPTVLAGVQLQSLRVQVVGEHGHAGQLPEGSRRQYDAVRAIGVRRSRDREAVAVGGRRDPPNGRAGPHGQVEALRILLEGPRHLVLAGEAPGLAGDAEPRQRVEPVGREQAQGIVLMAPVVADLAGGLEDHVVQPPPSEMVGRGEAGLSGADDHGVEDAVLGSGFRGGGAAAEGGVGAFHDSTVGAAPAAPRRQDRPSRSPASWAGMPMRQRRLAGRGGVLVIGPSPARGR